MAISDGKPIGQVDSVDGVLTVFREDGSEAELSQGDPIYLNDQVFTDAQGTAVIGLADGNTANIAADSSLIVDQSLYGGGGELSGASNSSVAAKAVPQSAVEQITEVVTKYGEPAGSVENMQGYAVVVRSDGTEEDLAQGDFVYPDDEIFTEEDSAVAIRFTDETSFSIGADSALVVDEYVYDPKTGDGAVDVSVLKGMFVFVSGLVADKSPDAMSIKTPTATVGIRGTEGMGKIGESDSESYFVNADGIITISTPSGTVVIDQINQTAVVLSPSLPPEMAASWSSEQVIQTFVSALRVAPLSVTQRVVDADVSLGGDARAVLSRAIKVMKAKQAEEKQQEEQGGKEGEAEDKGLGDGKASDDEESTEETVAEEASEEEAVAEEEVVEEKELPKKEERSEEEAVSVDESETESSPDEIELVVVEVTVDLAPEEPVVTVTPRRPEPEPVADRDPIVIEPPAEEVENIVPQTFEVAGLAIDSYISGAVVFFDANNNGIQDEGEPSAETDANGQYTLDIPNGASGSIIILAGGTDIATDETVNVNLSSPINAALAASGTVVVSPISTLVDNLINAGQSQAEALATVAQIAGVNNPQGLLTIDPIAQTLAGNGEGLALLQANVQIHALVALGASAISGASEDSISVADASAALFTAIAANPAALENGSPEELAGIVSQASGAVGGSLNETDVLALGSLLNTVASAADVAGDNQLEDDSTGQLVRLAQISDLIQSGLANEIATSFGEGTFQDVFSVELASGSINTRIAEITADELGIIDPNNANEVIEVSNLAPVAGSDTGAVDENSFVEVAVLTGLLANDSDADNDGLVVAEIRTGAELSAGTVGSVDVGLAGTFGTLTVAADGSYSYAADQAAVDALAVGETARDIFTYTASDNNGGSDTAELVITITGVNDGPVGLDDTGTVSEDATVTIPTLQGVLSNDLDVDGDALVVTSVTTLISSEFEETTGSSSEVILDANGDPVSSVGVSLLGEHGSLVLEADGSYAYTANREVTNGLAEGETLVDTFVYTLSDGNGGSSSAQLSITVIGNNDLPIAGADTGTVQENDTLVVVASAGVINNDLDVDGDSLSVSTVRTGNEAATGTIGSVGVGLLGALGTLTVAADGSYNYSANAAAADALAPGETATDTFTYTVSDGKGGTDTAELVITVVGVNDAPIALDDTFTINEDTAIANTENLLANDGDIDGSVSIVTTPISDVSNGSLTISSNGSFEYIPDQDFNGVDSFTYEITDENGASAEATVTINVSPVNDDPIAVDDSYSVDEDGVLTSQLEIDDLLINDDDVDGDSLTVSTTPALAPANGSLVLNSDGTFTYTPDESFSGEDSFSYEVTDGNGGSAVASVTIFVEPAIVLLEAQDDSFVVTEDGNLVDSVVSNDSSPGGLAATTVTLLDDAGNGNLTLLVNGQFEYVPNADFNGTDSFSYELSDGGSETDVATVSITVTPVNDDPIAVNDSYSVDEDGFLTSVLGVDDLTANDSDIDGDTLTVSATPLSFPSNGGLVINSDGTFTYTPNANFNGEDTFTYEVSDGNGGSAIATATITVNPVNDAPVALDDDVLVLEDTSAVGAVLFNDGDLDGDTLTVTLVDNVLNGSLTLDSDGTFTYDPEIDFSGADSFSYQIDDGNGGIDTATVSITVDPVNDDPEAANDAYIVDEDAVLNASLLDGLLINDNDAEGDVLTVNTVPVDVPANGSLVLNSDGTFTYTPNANFNGEDTFTYQVLDGNGGFSFAVATITVSPVNDAPELTSLSLLDDYSVAPLVAFDNAALGAGFSVSEDGLIAASVGNIGGEDFLNVFTLDGEIGEFEFSETISLGFTGFNDLASFVSINTDDGVQIQVLTREVDRFQTIEFNEGGAPALQIINAIPLSFVEDLLPPIGVNGETLLSLFDHGQLSDSGQIDGTVVAAFGDGEEIVIVVTSGEFSNIATVIDAGNTLGFTGSDSLALLDFGELLYVTQNTTADIQVFARDEGSDSYSLSSTLVAGVDIPAMGSEQLLQRSPDGTQLYVVEQPTVEGDSATLHIFDLIVFGEGEPEEGPVQLVASIPIIDGAGVAVEAVGQIYTNDLDAVIIVAEDGRLVSFDNPVDRLPTVDEDTTVEGLSLGAGALVSDFVDASDIDGDTIGIAVEEFFGAGDWFFSLDGGENWTLIDPASLESETDESVFLLADTARIFYEPAPDENGSDVGRLHYSAWDGSDGVSGSVYVDPAFGTALSNTVRVIHADVNPVNDQVIAEDDVFAVSPDTVLDRSVVFNDIDLEGDELFVETIPLVDVTNGTLLLNSDGSFSYTPNTGFVGVDSFEYEVSDGISSGTATAVVTINVTNTPELISEDLTFDHSFEAAVPFDAASFPAGTRLSEDGQYAVSVGHSAGNIVINFFALNDATGEFEFDSSQIIGPSFDIGAPIYVFVNDIGNDSYRVDIFNRTDDRFDQFEFSDTGSSLNVVQTQLGVPVSSMFQEVIGGGNLFDLFFSGQAANSVLDEGGRILAFGDGASINFVETFIDASGETQFEARGGLFVGDGTGFIGSDSIALGSDGNVLYVTQDSSSDIQVFNDTGFGYQQVAILSSGFDIPSMGTEQFLQRSPDGTQLYIVDAPCFEGAASRLFIFDILIANDFEPDGLLRLVDSFDLVDGLGNPIEEVAQIVVQELGSVLVVSDLDGEIAVFNRQVDRLLAVDEDSGGPIDGVTVGTAVSSFLAASDLDGDPLGIAVGSLNGAGTWYFSVDGGTTWEFIDTRAFDIEDESILLLLDGNSQLFYEPAPDESGDDIASLAYTVWDGNEGTVGTYHNVFEFGNGAFGDTVGTLNATINAVNDDAVAVDDVFFVAPDSSLDASVIANDFDVDGDALVVSTTPIADVSNGVLTLNSDGTFTYTPNTGFSGVDSFEYEVNDGISSSSTTAVVTIEVNNPPELIPESLSFDYSLDAVVAFDLAGSPAGTAISDDGLYAVSVGNFAGADVINFYIFNESTQEFEADSSQSIQLNSNATAPTFVSIDTVAAGTYQVNVFNHDQDSFSQFEFSESLGLDIQVNFIDSPLSAIFQPVNGGGNFFDLLAGDHSANSIRDGDGGVTLEAFGDGTQIQILENFGGGQRQVLDVLTAGSTPGFNGSDSIAFALDGFTLYVTRDDSSDILIFEDAENGYELVDTLVAGVDLPAMGPEQLLQRSPDGTQLYVVEQSTSAASPAVLHIFDITITVGDGGNEGQLIFVESIDVVDGVGAPIESVAQVVVSELGFVLVVAEDGNIVSLERPVERLNPVDEDSGAPVSGTVGTLVSSFLAATDADAGDVLGIGVGGFNGNGTWHFSVDNGITWQAIDRFALNEADDDILLLLGPDSQLFYEPAPDENGDNIAEVLYVAWDGRAGVEGEFFSVTEFGEGPFGNTVDVLHATVTPVNDAPFASDDSFVVNENSVLEGAVLDNDFDFDGDLLEASLAEESDVSDGVLSLNSDGTFTYTPNTGFIGSDSFTYEVSDGAGGVATATAFISVDEFNASPELIGPSLTLSATNQGQAFSVPTESAGSAFSPDGRFLVSVGNFGGDDHINVYVFNNTTEQYEFGLSAFIGASVDPASQVHITIGEREAGEYEVLVFSEASDRISQFQLAQGISLPELTLLAEFPFNALSQDPIDGNGTLIGDLFGFSHFSVSPLIDGDEQAFGFADGAQIIIRDGGDDNATTLAVIDSANTFNFTGSSSIALFDQGEVLLVAPPVSEATGDILVFAEDEGVYQFVVRLEAGVDIPDAGPDKLLQASADGNQIYVVQQGDVGVAAILHVFDVTEAIFGDTGSPEDGLRLSESVVLIDNNGIPIEQVSQVVAGTVQDTVAIVADDGRVATYDLNIGRINAVDEDAGAPINGITLGTPVSDFLAASDLEGDTVGVAIWGASGDGIWHFSTDNGGIWTPIDTNSFSDAANDFVLTLDPTARVYYEPAPDENGEAAAGLFYVAWDAGSGEGINGQFISDSFLEFGNGSAFGDTSSTVFADVNAIDDLPFGLFDEFLVEPDGVLFGDVLANDEADDPDGDALVVSLTPLVDVSNGTLSLNSDGTFSYTPNTGFVGTDSFEYELSDGNSFSSATVFIAVEPINQSPVLNLFNTTVTIADGGLDGFVGPLFDFDSGQDAIFDSELSSVITDGDYTGASIIFNVEPGDGSVVFFDNDLAFGPTSNLLVETVGSDSIVTDNGSTIASITPIAEGFRLDFVSNGGEFANQEEANDIVQIIDFELTNLAGTTIDVSVDDGVFGINDSENFGVPIFAFPETATT